MALSSGCKKHLKAMITNAQNHVDELISAVDNATLESSRESALVEAIGVTDDLVGVDGTDSNAAPLVGTEARLDAIEAKIDELIAALIAADLMGEE